MPQDILKIKRKVKFLLYFLLYSVDLLVPVPQGHVIYFIHKIRTVCKYNLKLHTMEKIF